MTRISPSVVLQGPRPPHDTKDPPLSSGQMRMQAAKEACGGIATHVKSRLGNPARTKSSYANPSFSIHRDQEADVFMEAVAHRALRRRECELVAGREGRQSKVGHRPWWFDKVEGSE